MPLSLKMRFQSSISLFIHRARMIPASSDFPSLSTLKGRSSNFHGWDSRSQRTRYERYFWSFLTFFTAFILEANGSAQVANAYHENIPEHAVEGSDNFRLQKIDDGSVVSNTHTINWRIFTDKGSGLFKQGNLKEAEMFFKSALQEAKEGFGEKDPHVASACNNLAEFYRVLKDFNKAEPLYREAVDILEESYGPDDIRVAAALHNVGQFLLVQHKLEEAQQCYERSLKIKRRILGEHHTEYAETMFSLGKVLYHLGKAHDAESLILEATSIMEENDGGETMMQVKRLKLFSQIYLSLHRYSDAESVLRKILHVMELLKGWKSLDTISAANELSFVLERTGNLEEAEELLERCLGSRRSLLPDNHIHVAGNMLDIARVKTNARTLEKVQTRDAVSRLNEAKELLKNTSRIAKLALSKPEATNTEQRNALRRLGLIILLRSFNILGTLETTKLKILKTQQDIPICTDAEKAYLQCISAYREFEAEFMSDSSVMKREYFMCLSHLFNLVSNSNLEDLKDLKTDRCSTKEPDGRIRELERELSHYLKKNRTRAL